MYEFHKDRKHYFDMQTANAEQYVIPFIEVRYPITEGMKVLEVGCGEGGVIKAFINKGCYGVGVDMDASRIVNAKKFMPDEISSGRVEFFSADIYDQEFETKFQNQFDLIVLKDVIEHIHNQKRIMDQFKKYLKTGGHIYFGFPPFHMPFGGHQQVSTVKLFAYIPWTHLLPMTIYKGLLNMLKVPSAEEFVEIKETGITTARFESICKELNYEFVHSTFYLINPIYRFKFGLKPRVQLDFIRSIPVLRDFVTTCVYYLIKK